ncbi:MAG: PrsW family intramembrane metalloprotease [Solobacterium sp.]|nr:PrsW family intramembrane metalloprotease [Solobacterium sp.]
MITAIYVAAAILPAIFLMYYIYQNDTIEKEPMSLLLRLVLSGVYAAGLALVLELIGDRVLGNISFESELQIAVAEAIMIAISEEGAKLLFLYRRTWKNPNFNFRYDGIVYAVFVSLGFAALENIEYVFQFGLSIAVSRALLAVPAHMAFGVFMGAYYGRAKVYDVYGKTSASTLSLILGFLAAVFLHAFYDACALLSSDRAMLVFIAFVVVMYVVVINKVRRESQTDHEI